MNKMKTFPKVRLAPNSPLAKGLILMIEHKKLRKQFWTNEITLEELNKLMLEKGIQKQYDHPEVVPGFDSKRFSNPILVP